MRKKIINLINNLSIILDIETPKIEFTDNFPTPTMMGECSSDGKTIRIKNVKDMNFDYIFAIAHELRHCYQIQTNRETYLFNYNVVTAFQNANEYNNQFAEIDANAFGLIVMRNTFGVRPLFNGLSNDTILKIEKRAIEIDEELLQNY